MISITLATEQGQSAKFGPSMHPFYIADVTVTSPDCLRRGATSERDHLVRHLLGEEHGRGAACGDAARVGGDGLEVSGREEVVDRFDRPEGHLCHEVIRRPVAGR